MNLLLSISHYFCTERLSWCDSTKQPCFEWNVYPCEGKHSRKRKACVFWMDNLYHIQYRDLNIEQRDHSSPSTIFFLHIKSWRLITRRSYCPSLHECYLRYGMNAGLHYNACRKRIRMYYLEIHFVSLLIHLYLLYVHSAWLSHTVSWTLIPQCYSNFLFTWPRKPSHPICAFCLVTVPG